MTSQSIVITGEGIVSAIGIGKAAVKESLLNLHTGIGDMRYLDSRVHNLPVGEVKMSNKDMKTRLGISAERELSRTTLMGIMAVRQAFVEAKIPTDRSFRVVLISGTTVAGMDITERKFKDWETEGQPSDWIEHHDCGSCTADIASYFDCFNDYTTISTACSSAANALILGADMLKAGDADIVVAGGSEALSCFHLNGFNSLMILDHNICRPFDKNRAGLNLGEGAAYVVMEREDDATRRGANIDAWLSGYDNACDAYHQTASSPEDTGAQMAMRGALKMSGIGREDIQWIHAHGTGTPDNDKSEAVAIREVFGNSQPTVSSTKGYTGHTTSASGSISAVISIIAMNGGFIPANIGLIEPIDERLKLPTTNISRPVHNVMVNSFGFGGNDSCLILSDNRHDSTNADFTKPIEIVEASRIENEDIDGLKDIKQYVSPMEARRMGKLMKSTLLTSMRALEAAGVDMPDAIVTGTAFGSLEYSERLLKQLADGDDTFKPTFFMQSTHNTISSLIAIHLRCHGYNITFTQGSHSLNWAMYQARLLLLSGRCNTVLVGCHDESTPLFNRLLQQTGKEPMPDVSSVAIVLKRKN